MRTAARGTLSSPRNSGSTPPQPHSRRSPPPPDGAPATPIPDGLYKIASSGPEGTEYGVANLHAGKRRGGDSGMAHVGTYGQEGDWLRAELCVTRHRHVPGVVSAPATTT